MFKYTLRDLDCSTLIRKKLIFPVVNSRWRGQSIENKKLSSQAHIKKIYVNLFSPRSINMEEEEAGRTYKQEKGE